MELFKFALDLSPFYKLDKMTEKQIVWDIFVFRNLSLS